MSRTTLRGSSHNAKPACSKHAHDFVRRQGLVAVLLSVGLHAATVATIATAPQEIRHIALPNAETTTSGSRALAPAVPVHDHPARVATVPARALPGSPQFQPAGSSTSHRIAAHIWRATAFAIGLGLLTVAFRRNGAHVRYALWLSASLVFLLPVRPPFLPVPSFPDAPVSAGTLLLAWTFGFAAIAAIRFAKWRSLRRIVRSSSPAALPATSSMRRCGFPNCALQRKRLKSARTLTRATAFVPAAAYRGRAAYPADLASRQRRWRLFEISTRSAESIFEPTRERSIRRL